MLDPTHAVRNRATGVVIAGLLLASLLAVPAGAVPPTLGGEQDVSDTLTGIAYDQQATPEIATNGLVHLAVWRDGRSTSPFNNAVWGTRLASDGVKLDDVPLVISDNGQDPEVASDGDDFLVVFVRSNDVYGTLVDGAGEGVIGEPFVIASGNDQQSEPGVAFDGTNYLVVWADYGLDAIAGVRISPAGVIQDGTPLDIASSANFESSPVVASNGTSSYVAWTVFSASSDIYGTVVGDDGTVEDPDGVAVKNTADEEQARGLESNGTDYLLTFMSVNTTTENQSVLAARIQGDGTVVDATSLVISAGSTDTKLTTDVASSGTDYLVTWWRYPPATPNDARIYGTRVTSAGVVTDSPTPLEVGLLATLSDRPAAAAIGGTYLVVYGDGDISAKTVAASNGAVGIRREITTSAFVQEFGDIAAGSDGYLVAWAEGPAFLRDVFVGRLSTTGERLDGPGTDLHQDWSGSEPKVAWNGSVYLVVWRVGNNIYATRVSAAGVPLDEVPLVITQNGGPQQADVASRGGDFLVVWQAHSGLSLDIYALKVPGTGPIPDADQVPISMTTEDGIQYSPHVAATTGEYLVTWSNGNLDTDELEAAIFDPDALDPAGPVQSMTTSAYWPQDAYVASNGSSFAVAWSQQNEDANEDTDLYLARVDATGAIVSPGAPLANDTTVWETVDSISWDGFRYLITYRHDNEVDVDVRRAMRVTPSGTPIPGDPFNLPFVPLQATQVASAIPGTAAMLYGRNGSVEAYGFAPRLFTRVADSRPPASAMTKPTVPFQKAKAFAVGWTSPSDASDVFLRSAPVAGSLGTLAKWKNGSTGTGATYTGTPGATHCFSVASRNAEGYLSARSAERCTAVPLDDPALARAGTWAKKKAAGYYLNTYSQSSKKGSTLSRNVRGKSFALVATKGRGFGTVKVFLGKTLLKQVALNASSLKKKQLIPLKSFGSTRTGKLRIVVVTSGKVVRIEGVGVSAV